MLYLVVRVGESMARRCEICGKGRSWVETSAHAHNVTRRRFQANIQTVRAVVNGGVKRLRVCTRCIRSTRSPRPPSCPNPKTRTHADRHRNGRCGGRHRPVLAGCSGRATPVRLGPGSSRALNSELVDDDIGIQTDRVMRSIGAILDRCGRLRSQTSRARRCFLSTSATSHE